MWLIFTFQFNNKQGAVPPFTSSLHLLPDHGARDQLVRPPISICGAEKMLKKVKKKKAF